VILFISDHGYRFGSFRETVLGYYEESLPFFFLRLPPRLKKEFPQWYTNLKINSNRLTSPFNLYNSLIDLYSLGFENKSKISITKSSSSFFDLSPEDINCEDSGIPQKYCRCGVSPELLPSSAMTSDLGRFVVKEVNGYLGALVQNGTCALLNMSSLLYSRELGSGEVGNMTEEFMSYTDYLVALVTIPRDGKFEAKIRIFQNSTKTIIGEVSRINSYEGLSDCMSDYRLKNYCICSDVLKKRKGS